MTTKPTCTDCGTPDSAVVYYGATERLCPDCYAAPPKSITVYVGGAHGAKGWWWNNSGGGREMRYVREDLANADREAPIMTGEWGVFDTWGQRWCPRAGTEDEMRAHAEKINGQIIVNRGPKLQRYEARKRPTDG